MKSFESPEWDNWISTFPRLRNRSVYGRKYIDVLFHKGRYLVSCFVFVGSCLDPRHRIDKSDSHIAYSEAEALDFADEWAMAMGGWESK